MKCNGKHLNFMFTLNRDDLIYTYFNNCLYYSFYFIIQDLVKRQIEVFNPAISIEGEFTYDI